MKPWEETWAACNRVQVRAVDPEPSTRVPPFVDWDDFGAPDAERKLAPGRANLTAAAPDLYRALEGLVDVLDDEWDCSDAVNTALRALAKARGER